MNEYARGTLKTTLAALTLFCLMVLPCFTGQAEAEVRLLASKPAYGPGEDIQIDYSGLPGNSQDWLTLVPISATEDTYGEWFYTGGKTSGTYVFKGQSPGTYEVRCYLNWPSGGYNVVARITLTVGASAPPPASAASLTLAKNQFAPGEAIVVTFSAGAYPQDAWVGIIPSNVPHGDEATNDGHDIAYQYLKGQTSGTLTFTAPAAAGAYDLRMHDTDGGGKEVASVSFTVGAGGPSLSLPKTTFAPGESVVVTFTADAAFPQDAWVGIIPSNVPHGDEATNDGHDIAYQYLKGQTSGALTFTAPGTPGAYDLRMHDTDGGGKEVASVSFVVQ